jgi:putative redox protein
MDDAFTPMEFFLIALAGCTAMDVQWILNRQRQKFDRFDIDVHGKRRDDDPRYYESIDLEYVFAGDGLRKDAVERAIRLSQEKYCSVRAMINDKVKFNITYKIGNLRKPAFRREPRKISRRFKLDLQR